MGVYERQVQGISRHDAINGLISNSVDIVESYNMLMEFRKHELNYLVIFTMLMEYYLSLTISIANGISLFQADLVQWLAVKKSKK